MLNKTNTHFDPTAIDRTLELKGLELANFKDRAFAFCIDFAILFIIFVFILISGATLLKHFDYLDPKENITLNLGFSNWYSLVFIVLYFGLFTYFGKGSTPGKRIMQIRVISLLHHQLSLWHSIERSLGYGASALEFGFGFAQYFINPNRRTVHDRIAETIVVKEHKKEKIESKVKQQL